MTIQYNAYAAAAAGEMEAARDAAVRRDPRLRLLAADLLREAHRELRWLRLVRGPSRRTARRRARATAVLLAAAALLGAAPLASRAQAADPHFINPFAFGPAKVGHASSPALADIDGDGDLDGFIGSNDGHTFFARNTGSALLPAFATPVPDAFGLVTVGSYASPTFADIDGDGDLDAVIGQRDVGTPYGSIILFRNTGTARAPAFAAPQELLDMSGFPAFADIDGDGDLDGFIGAGNGDLIFFRNTGTVRVPAFAAPVTNPFGLVAVDARNRPAFVDIDGDGDLDALVGSEGGDTIFFRNTGSAQAPAFAAPVTNPFGLAEVGHDSTPAFGDLDGDGDLDAVIGARNGDTLLFRNTGSARAPAFVAPVQLADLEHYTYYSRPAFADIDGDGDLDAFVGTGIFVNPANGGDTLFFRNTGTARAPAFAAPVTNPFGLINVGDHSNPAFADLDADGDIDAFIGNRDGETLFFGNTGSAREPAFAVSPGLADVSAESSPAFADIDADGDLDVFVGEVSGNILFYDNTGSARAPAFAAPLTNPFGLTDAGADSTPAFGDVDGDGDLDVLVGERSGNTLFFRNTGNAQAPAFAPPVTNPFGLVDVGRASTPALVDIDGDGDLDVFIGEAEGRTVLFENRAPCPGDCNQSGQVGIDELIRGVNIALGSLELSACAAMDGSADGTVTIGELIAAVNAALSGCPP